MGATLVTDSKSQLLSQTQWVAKLLSLFKFVGLASIYFFMLSPLIFVIWLSFFADSIPAFPPTGYSLKWYVNAWENQTFMDGLVLSLKLGVIAAFGSVVFGTAAAIALNTPTMVGRSLIRSILLSPLVVPSIVAGVAVYLFFLRAEDVLDRNVVGTFPALVIAHICITIPWTLRLVTANLESIDVTIEEAASNLGASAMVVFWRVTLPMLRPAIVASTLFSFIISFENLEVTLPLVGPGQTTLPIAIMQYLEFSLDPTIAAVSAVQIALLAIVMVVSNRFVKISQVI